jgi:transmembrane sensor
MKHISPELLQKYSQHLCNTDEKAVVEEWLNEQNNIFKDGLLQAPVRNEELVKNDIWKGIQQRKNSSSSRRFMLYKTLAAACITGIIGVLSYYQFNKTDTKMQLAATAISFTAPAGEPSTLFLPDSSKVYLMSGSTISYSTNFSSENNRVLQLKQGEIFLEVTHNEKKPFLLECASGTIKVLGTKFNVKNNFKDSLLYVTLNEGSIQFEVAGTIPQKLIPGQQLLFNKQQNKTIALQTTNLNIATGWINKQLIFKEAPVHQVLERIESYYGIRFIKKSSADSDKTLTGTFDNMNLKEVLTMIHFSTGIQFKIEQHTITVY